MPEEKKLDPVAKLTEDYTGLANNVLTIVHSFLQQEMGNKVTENNSAMLELKLDSLFRQRIPELTKPAEAPQMSVAE